MKNSTNQISAPKISKSQKPSIIKSTIIWATMISLSNCISAQENIVKTIQPVPGKWIYAMLQTNWFTPNKANINHFLSLNHMNEWDMIDINKTYIMSPKTTLPTNKKTTPNNDKKSQKNKENPKKYSIENISDAMHQDFSHWWKTYQQYRTQLWLSSIKIDQKLFCWLIIKESRWKNSARSIRNARWYGQLLPPAIQDTQKKLKEAWINQSFDPIHNWSDNITFSLIYFALQKQKIATSTQIKWSDNDFFVLLAYNAGPTKVFDLVDTYCKNTKQQQASWIWFRSWILTTILHHKKPSISTIDDAYHIPYQDVLAGFTPKNKVVYRWKYGKYNIRLTDTKAHEMIRYVQMIDAIATSL